MYKDLKPCPQRRVDDGGRILCGLLRSGDKEVSVNLCRTCPLPQINCAHLRATMEKKASIPITVRFATGRVEVWDDEPPTIGFKQAACAVKTMPIHSPRDCAGCPLRQPNMVPHQQQPAAPVVAPTPAAPSAPVIQELRAPVPPLRATAARAPAQALVQRAQRLAVEQRRAAAAERTAPRGNPENVDGPETKPKIIQLQKWLASQLHKKQASPHLPKYSPDADGVSAIIYDPITPTYQEEPGELERCVGWTD